MRIDTISGMFSSQAVNWAIIVVAATVLPGNGVTNIQTAADAARALLPLVHTFPNSGRVAQALFAAGIIGLGLLAVPVLAGSASYAVSESLQWVEGLDQKLTRAWGFYGVIIVATAAGLLLNFIGINPIKALVYAAVLNGVVAVPLLFVMAPPRQEQEDHGAVSQRLVLEPAGLAALPARVLRAMYAASQTGRCLHAHVSGTAFLAIGFRAFPPLGCEILSRADRAKQAYQLLADVNRHINSLAQAFPKPVKRTN